MRLNTGFRQTFLDNAQWTPFQRKTESQTSHVKKKKKKGPLHLVESVLLAYFSIKVARGSRQSCCGKAAPRACDLHKKCALEAFQFLKNL